VAKGHRPSITLSVSVDSEGTQSELATASLAGDAPADATPERDSHAEPVVGDFLGQFRVEARIGSGGLGVVYRAYDVKLKRQVALKVLAEGAARVERLLAEARSAAALTHASIAAIYDVQQIDGVAFLVMELVEGRTLRDELSRGKFAPARAISFAIDVASAVARAHERGIVHRDLKPENVIVTPDGHAKILDFGLARAITESPTVRSVDGALAADRASVSGTRHYMSPEQAAGERAEARADVFALGVMFYEMLAGQRPFAPRAERDPRKWREADWRVEKKLQALAPTVSSALARIVERCMSLDPAARFADAGEVSLALRRLGQRSARRIARLGAAATLVMAGVVAGVVAWQRPPPPLETLHKIVPRPRFEAAGQTWEIVDGTWTRDGDALVGGSGHVQTTFEMEDGTIDLDFDVPLTGPHGTLGIGYRYTLTGDSPKAQCGYGFNFNNTPRMASLIGDDGDWNPLGPEGFHPAPVLKLDHNHFVIHMTGASFVIEANGQVVDSFTDGRWPRGRLNLWVQTATARISNVRITPTPHP
jgi:tRNA A-37 threonylcarbamoyl transferase component Bud32